MKANGFSFRTFIAVISVLAVTYTARGDVILRDHVTQSSLWDGIGGAVSVEIEEEPRRSAVGAATFTGNGGTLTRISGIFYNYSGANDGGPVAWAGFRFRFIFYESVSAFKDGPFSGSFAHVFSQPSNSDWLTPVGWAYGHQLYRFDFDLSGLGVKTTGGALQLAAVLPVVVPGDLPDIPYALSAGISFSTAGQGAVGSELDWYQNVSLNRGPGTFRDFAAPEDYLAYKIAATVPGPSSVLCLVLGTPHMSNRRRRI